MRKIADTVDGNVLIEMDEDIERLEFDYVTFFQVVFECEEIGIPAINRYVAIVSESMSIDEVTKKALDIGLNLNPSNETDHSYYFKSLAELGIGAVYK